MSWLNESYLSNDFGSNVFDLRAANLSKPAVKPSPEPNEIDRLSQSLQNRQFIRGIEFQKAKETMQNAPKTGPQYGPENNPNPHNTAVITINANQLMVLLTILLFVLVIMNALALRRIATLQSALDKKGAE